MASHHSFAPFVPAHLIPPSPPSAASVTSPPSAASVASPPSSVPLFFPIFNNSPFTPEKNYPGRIPSGNSPLFSKEAYYPPPPPPPAQVLSASVVVLQPGRAPPTGIIFRGKPLTCLCPRCHERIVTKVNYQCGILSWILCGGICLFGGFVGCCLIPFCIKELKDASHICPLCKEVIGFYRRL